MPPEHASRSRAELGRNRADLGRRLAIGMIVLTAAACGAALFLRTPIRAWNWAGRAIRTTDPAERAVLLSALCNAGDAGRWGTQRLLRHSSDAVRAGGVIVLHHVRSPWARRQLLARMADASPQVRELAALGLAIHGDQNVIPRLVEMFRGGDPDAVGAASAALERLATPAAVGALAELAGDGGTVVQIARIIDALEAIGTPECVPVLVRLLDDHRACDLEPRGAELARAALRDDALAARLASAAFARADPRPSPASQPMAAADQLYAASMPAPNATLPKGAVGLGAPPPTTLGERGAAALARITGRHAPFSSSMPPEQRRAAADIWTLAQPKPGPP